MIWLYRWIVDFFDSLAAWYYRRKYGAAARQLGRSPYDEDQDRRGFIIVEIDGLAYDYLRQAMNEGYMPYFSRMVLLGGLRLARWRCGLPSTTPASQAGILYGNNWDIPGFRWYDKETRTPIMCKQPGAVRAIQERVASGRAGLLRGGSSYTNMFDGDARLSLFTLSALGRHRLFENVRGLGFLLLFGISPLRVVRILGLSLWAWLAYVIKRFASWIQVRPRDSRFTFFGPLLEIFNNIIFREVTTFSVMVDVYRGMPAIYAAYTGYDEIAHHFGADSYEAFRALRALDKQIRQIDRMRQLYDRREYDLYVLSDHGMTPSVSFQSIHDQTLQEFIAERTGQEVQDGEQEEETEGLPEARAHFLLDEIRALEARQRRPVPARLLQVTRQRLEEELLTEIIETEWDLSRRSDITVRNSGSLSHVYFDITPRQMDLSEIALLYPSLLEDLVQNESVQCVIGREGDRVVIAGREGSVWIRDGAERQEGENPLGRLPYPDWAAEQVARVARFPHAGDLMLLGAWDGEQVVSFEDQLASHGGLGGPQDWPFLAFPAEEGLAARGIESSEELYTRLVGIYGQYG